mmetsp:Transcript_60337/g.95842  ORF Transcript_60337/g.95842 Transcript_60337/m.95842 type:complete len:101 (+) Transcript_60337:615-917(+)
MCTEYSTASAVLIKQDMAVKPLSLTEASPQKPTTVKNEMPEVKTITSAPTKEVPIRAKQVPLPSIASSATRKKNEIAKPAAREIPIAVYMNSFTVKYCSQ